MFVNFRHFYIVAACTGVCKSFIREILTNPIDQEHNSGPEECTIWVWKYEETEVALMWHHFPTKF